MKKLLLLLSLTVACTSTRPGTHVELVSRGGQQVYISGAAGPGVNKGVACRMAVSRAVGAIALRFSQEQDDVADDVAEAVGVSDGKVFLERFAKAKAMEASVQDVKFDPIEHICMASISWTPPVFIKDAVQAYAEELKRQELAETKPPQSAPAHDQNPAAATTQAPATAAPAPRTPPPAAAPVSTAPPAPAPAPKPIASCGKENRAMGKARSKSQGYIDDLTECRSRTSGDDQVCHRYKLWVEEGAKGEAKAGAALTKCLNRHLSSSVRSALSRELPGHAAVNVETSAGGGIVLWTYSPAKQTAFVVEAKSDGSLGDKSPLAANQIQWLKSELGL